MSGDIRCFGGCSGDMSGGGFFVLKSVCPGILLGGVLSPGPSVIETGVDILPLTKSEVRIIALCAFFIHGYSSQFATIPLTKFLIAYFQKMQVQYVIYLRKWLDNLDTFP
ncbi:MAG: hypothetical protein JXL20_00605 [Deltaproteobacteria bacterium]|nr:hypothetical protein [Deltaproteobacteria bacterium]